MNITNNANRQKRRCNAICIRMYDDEFEIVNAKAAKVPYSREQFCRSVLLGCEVKERPPAEYAEIVRQLRIIGSNVHQLLLKAIQTKFIDTVILQEVYEMTVEMDDLFCTAFIDKRGKKWRK